MALRPLASVAATSIVDVSSGDTYEAWPVIMRADNGNIVVLYGDGSTHTVDEGREVLAQVSTDDGRTWGATATVASDPAVDQSVYGAGRDSEGNLLAWVLSRTGTGSGTTTGVRVIRSTDNGQTWADLADPSWSPMPVLIWNVVSVPTVGLMAAWHGFSSNWGIVTSADDGATWTQTVVETGVGASQQPVEIELVYVGAGRILGLARRQSGGAMFQLQSDDYGATWSRADTNISELLTPAAVVLHDDRHTLDVYLYDRDDGNIEWFRTTVDDVWDAPTSWPTSTVVATQAGLGADAGYTHAVRTPDGVNLVAFYTGSSPTTQVKVLRHTTSDGVRTAYELDDLTDATTAGGSTGDVLTQQADGTYAPQAPSGGGSSTCYVPVANGDPDNPAYLFAPDGSGLFVEWP